MSRSEVLSRFLVVVQAFSSSLVMQWVMMILVLTQAFAVSGWPAQYHVKGGDSFDFVVVGAGSAGAIVAARLSEIPHIRVLLVEAGGDPPLASVVPSLFSLMVQTKYDWDYLMYLDKDVGRVHINQTLNLIRGKMLGGCSSINNELYARGEPVDYDEWAEASPGWDWNSVLYYFKKFENMMDPTVFSDPNNANLHSTDGPVKITRQTPNSYFREITENVLSSYEEIGIKRVLEMNGLDALGGSIPHFTLADGRRSSTAEAYLRDNRPNLYVAKYTRALKILIDPNTSRAYGVNLLTESGELVNVTAVIEVILSAGSIDSPKLLMLSGIGPTDELNKFDIQTIVDLPVGRNLHDHQFVPIIFSGKKGFATAIQGLFTVMELDSMPVPTQNAFINVDGGDRRQLQVSNIHLGALPSFLVQRSCESSGFNSSYCKSLGEVSSQGASDWSLLVLLHPKSRGRVGLNSKDPLADPFIETGFLNNKEDIELMAKGVKYMSRLVNTTYYRQVESKLVKLDVPGCSKSEQNDDEYWTCYVTNVVSSIQHPVGTCMMGSDGVVDERLRVHGVLGLRVIDASIMPEIPGGNTNGPAMMIGEKGADIVKEDYSLMNANEIDADIA